MTITLMLAWYDEPEELLHEAVSSGAVIADRIVCADGRYEQVDGPATSPATQRKTIERAAASVGLEADFLSARVWAGQVEKRQALLRAATEGFQTGDYIMPLDADWRLHGSREAIHHELANAKYTEQWSVLLHQTVNPSRNGNGSFPHAWHEKYAGKTKREPLLFRALYDMKLEKTHWHYSGCRSNGTRVGLSGGVKLGYRPPYARDLEAPFFIEHRAMYRDARTLKRNKDFCEARDKERELVGYER